jgi:hypothetical protein
MKKQPVDRASVSAIRQRYFQAMANGMRPADAAKFANTGEAPPAVTVRQQVEQTPWPELARAAARLTDAPITSRAQAEEVVRTAPPAKAIAIPDDWRTLGWPQLRGLAMRIKGGQIGKAGRSDVEEIIEEELERRLGA